MSTTELGIRYRAAADRHAQAVALHRRGIVRLDAVVRAERARSDAFRAYHDALLIQGHPAGLHDAMAAGHA